MGEVIHKGAAREDIFADATRTASNAAAKGGIWKKLAEEILGGVLALIAIVVTKAKAAAEAIVPLVAKINAMDEKADKLLGQIYDEIWNLLGRPGNDPALAVLFPGGITYYADGADSEQPDRMELLAELLEGGIHPRLEKAKAADLAKSLRDLAAEYRALLDAARAPKAKAVLYERVTSAVARSTQMALMTLKRRYLAERFSEAEIHTVIPDRPSAAAKPKDDKKT